MKKNDSQIKIGSFLSYISLFISVIVSLTYTPILISYIGMSEYGVYQLIASIVSYLSILESTLSATTIRYYTIYRTKNDKEMQEKTLFTSKKVFLLISIIIVLIGVFIYALFGKFYDDSLSVTEIEHAEKAFLILLVQLFIEVNACIYSAIIVSSERFVFIKLMSIASSILNPVVVLLIASEFPYAYAIAIGHVGISLGMALLKWYYATRLLSVRIVRSQYDKKLFREMSMFAFSLLLSVIADQLFWKTDQIVLSKTSGTIKVAIYSVGSTIFTTFISLGSVISNLFLPRVTALEAENDKMGIHQLIIKVGRYQFILLSLIYTGFLLFGKEFINLWVGADYDEVYLIVLLIITPLLFDLCEAICLSVLQARNKFAIRSYMYLGMAVINVILTFLLASKYDGTGAALATCISILCGSLSSLNVYYIKCQKLPIIKLFKEIAKILIIYVILIPFGVFLNGLLNNMSYINLIIKILIYCAVYVFSLFFVIKSEERKMIKEIIKNGIKKMVKN